MSIIRGLLLKSNYSTVLEVDAITTILTFIKYTFSLLSTNLTPPLLPTKHLARRFCNRGESSCHAPRQRFHLLRVASGGGSDGGNRQNENRGCQWVPWALAFECRTGIWEFKEIVLCTPAPVTPSHTKILVTSYTKHALDQFLEVRT